MTEPSAQVTITLQELFAIQPGTLAAAIGSSLERGFEQRGHEKLQQWRAIEQSPRFAELVGEHVCGFLTDSVAGILAGAWHTYHELRKAGAETLAEPELHAEVALSEHEFSYDLNPCLEVLAAGVRLGEIAFEISATFVVHGLTLSLRRGCVDAVRSGKADCSLLILCDGTTVFSRTLLALDLPGTVHLSKPVCVAVQSATPAPRRPESL